MPIIKIKKRKCCNQLGNLLPILYEDVLLSCETEKSPIKNKTTAKEWLNFINSQQLELSYNYQKESRKFKSQKIGTKDYLVINSRYAQSNICDKIVFTSKYNQVFSSLFCHIRNAFAHNQIFVDKNSGYITMYDRLTPSSTAFTMIAYVKISVFEEMIKTIKELK